MASPGEALFEVPIASGGRIKCTTPAKRVYLVEFTSPPDNRLKTDFCKALLLVLDILEFRHEHGVVITTSGIPKFYSNGLDLDHAFFTPDFFSGALYALWRRLLIYPMPTVALINGHAFAGALMTAMYQDYRIMNPQKGFVCLNEVDMGVPLKPPMTSIFRQKTSPTTYRSLVIEGKRFPAAEALKAGIIDGLGGLEEVLKFIDERNLTTRPDKGVVGELKREMWRESLYYLENQRDEYLRGLEWQVARTKEDQGREEAVEKWESKAKL